MARLFATCSASMALHSDQIPEARGRWYPRARPQRRTLGNCKQLAVGRIGTGTSGTRGHVGDSHAKLRPNSVQVR
jgi:hypothetical protein